MFEKWGTITMRQEINIVGITFKTIFPADEWLKNNFNVHFNDVVTSELEMSLSFIAAFQKSGHISIVLQWNKWFITHCFVCAPKCKKPMSPYCMCWAQSNSFNSAHFTSMGMYWWKCWCVLLMRYLTVSFCLSDSIQSIDKAWAGVFVEL